MSRIRVPAGIPCPTLTYDATDDSVQFDPLDLIPILEINPEVGCTEDTVAALLAAWLLDDLDRGRRPDPRVAEVLLGPMGDLVH